MTQAYSKMQVRYIAKYMPCSFQHKPKEAKQNLGSVAMAIANVFRRNAISVGYKFTKMLKIFDKIDKMKGRRVI